MLLTEEEIEKTLKEALPGVPQKDIHRAAQSVASTMGKWKEVDLTEVLGASYSVQCKDICAIGSAFSQGKKIRTFVAEK